MIEGAVNATAQTATVTLGGEYFEFSAAGLSSNGDASEPIHRWRWARWLAASRCWPCWMPMVTGG